MSIVTVAPASKDKGDTTKFVIVGTAVKVAVNGGNA
jgi:hypothetical protein